MNKEKELLDGIIPDPIHFHENKWWFWDEGGADRHGPYETKEQAKKGLAKYGHDLYEWLERHGRDE